MNTVRIQGIATAHPKTKYAQKDLKDFMVQHIGTTAKKKAFIEAVYEGSAIEYRHSAVADFGLPMEQWSFLAKEASLLPEPTTALRNQIYSFETMRLAEECVGKLFAGLTGFDPQTITHIIGVSCTGFYAPGFDYHVCKTFGLRQDIQRFNIGFMGCLAAFPALKMAQAICLVQPEARVLIVDIELTTLHFHVPFQADTVVVNALFADGAAAVLISATDVPGVTGTVALHDFQSRLVPNTDTDMTWIIGDHGYEMRLSAKVPQFIEQIMRAEIDKLLLKNKLVFTDLDLWAVHPGGRVILEKIEAVLQLPPTALAPSYNVLRELGNMSSTTIFFVLKEILASKKKGKLFSCVFGPGLTMESGLMEIY